MQLMMVHKTGSAFPRGLPNGSVDTSAARLVVVVDDDPLVLDAMSGLLKSWGYRVVTALSGATLTTALGEQEQPPDLIISDYRLAAGETGIEVIEKLRATFLTPIPAVLISGETAPEDLRAFQASGHHLLHKPVTPTALRATLDEFLRA